MVASSFSGNSCYLFLESQIKFYFYGGELSFWQDMAGHRRTRSSGIEHLDEELECGFLGDLSAGPVRAAYSKAKVGHLFLQTSVFGYYRFALSPPLPPYNWYNYNIISETGWTGWRIERVRD